MAATERMTHRVVLHLDMADASVDISTAIRFTIRALNKQYGVRPGSISWRELQGTYAGDEQQDVAVASLAETETTCDS